MTEEFTRPLSNLTEAELQRFISMLEYISKNAHTFEQLNEPKTNDAWTSFSLTLKLLLILVSGTLNILALLVYIRSRKWRLPMGVYFIALTLNNLGMCLLAMTPSFIAEMSGMVKREINAAPACLILGFSSGFFTKGSILCQVLINLDRFVAIQWPYRYLEHMTNKKAIFFSLSTFILVGVLQCLSYFIHNNSLYVEPLQSCMSTVLENQLRERLDNQDYNKSNSDDSDYGEFII